MKTPKDKIAILNQIAKKNNDWINEQEWRRQNAEWIKISQRIALRILSILDEKGISQKELAERMGVSPQQVSKIVRGQENLTLETISKLEKCLETKIVDVSNENNSFSTLKNYTIETFCSNEFFKLFSLEKNNEFERVSENLLYMSTSC
ncbi:helix-turn-helix transcriptional regulator [Raineya orbicola]|uniref:Helix-turn-helix protein n=1 Tax=Raineya orbicola TaxID=2016530 RepID=A0A2N3II97_9BACT|nr:helix-turn-helix transcriptional regulator [Raineya orbicola]PKQ69978.1 Helix-turn-helix protein [Raineya orbicola]